MSIIKFEYDIKGKYILLSAHYVLGNMIEILYMLYHLILSTTQVRILFSLFYILVSQQKYKTKLLLYCTCTLRRLTKRSRNISGSKLKFDTFVQNECTRSEW